MKKWIFLFTVLLALGVTSCGSGDEDEDTIGTQDTLGQDGALDEDAVPEGDLPSVYDYGSYPEVVVPKDVVTLEDTTTTIPDTTTTQPDTNTTQPDIYVMPDQTTTSGCTTDADCPSGETCCAALIPGMPGSCAASCEGTGLPGMPTCESDEDCVGGQICQDLMGLAALCISACTTDDDCGGNTCTALGAMGFNLAQVCDCATDEDCGDPALKCCAVDVMIISVNTCLTECIDLSGLLGGL